MRPIAQALAATTLAAVVGAGLGACSSDPAAPDTVGDPTPSTSENATTTRSAAVPGPDGATVEVPAAVAERWDELGGTTSTLGSASGPANRVDGGWVADFSGGALVLTPSGRVFVVQGGILDAYRDAGGPEGDLGFPVSDETTTDGGWISAFEGGTIALLDGQPVVEIR